VPRRPLRRAWAPSAPCLGALRAILPEWAGAVWPDGHARPGAVPEAP